MGDEEKITTSLAELTTVMQSWLQEFRNGECMSEQEASAVSTEDLGRRNAEYVFTKLKALQKG